MKTIAQQPNHVQGLTNLFIVLGLITMFFVPTSMAAAQTGDVSTLLFDQLKWTSLGSAERTIFVNDDFVTFPGTAFQSVEQFNLENSENIANYYSTTNLANLGWQEISTEFIRLWNLLDVEMTPV